MEDIKRVNGIIRRIDDLGRIVIPKEIRCQYGITDGDSLEIMPTSEGIIIRKWTAERSILAFVQNLKAAIKDEEGLADETRAILLQIVHACEEKLAETTAEGE